MSQLTTETIHALNMVLEERQHQHDKWGVQRHSWPEWIAILTEEVGEAAQAAVESHFQGQDVSFLLEELVHTAAVAVSIIEHINELDTEGQAAMQQERGRD